MMMITLTLDLFFTPLLSQCTSLSSNYIYYTVPLHIILLSLYIIPCCPRFFVSSSHLNSLGQPSNQTSFFPFSPSAPLPFTSSFFLGCSTCSGSVYKTAVLMYHACLLVTTCSHLLGNFSCCKFFLSWKHQEQNLQTETDKRREREREKRKEKIFRFCSFRLFLRTPDHRTRSH